MQSQGHSTSKFEITSASQEWLEMRIGKILLHNGYCFAVGQPYSPSWEVPLRDISMPDLEFSLSKASPSAEMASLFTNSAALTRGKGEVYVAAVPLRASKGPAQLLMSAAYTLNIRDLQHFMVIIKRSTPSSHSQAFVFDFQPKDPENIYTALEVLSGRSVPGAVLVRKLTKLPRNKCWFIGSSKLDAVDLAIKFNESWETDLRVGHHDCRDYTNGLVEHLTGKKHVLEHLRSIGGRS